MSEDEIDEELESIEYAQDKIELVINELEDLAYWRTELDLLEDFKDRLDIRLEEVKAEQKKLWEREGY